MYFAQNGRKCQACGKIGGHIVVHHVSYDNFMREPMRDLVGLCNPCHVEVHRRHRAGVRQDLRMVTMRYIMEKRNNKRR